MSSAPHCLPAPRPRGPLLLLSLLAACLALLLPRAAGQSSLTYYSGVALDADNTYAYVAAETSILAISLCGNIDQSLSSTDGTSQVNGNVYTLATAEGLGLDGYFFNGLAVDYAKGVAYVTFETTRGADFDPRTSVGPGAQSGFTAYLATISLTMNNTLLDGFELGSFYARGLALNPTSTGVAYVAVTSFGDDLSSGSLTQTNVPLSTGGSPALDKVQFGRYTEASGVAVSADGSTVYFTVNSFTAPESNPESAVYVYTTASGGKQLVGSPDQNTVFTDVAVSPDGRVLYVTAGIGANSGGDHSGYDGTGALYTVSLNNGNSGTPTPRLIATGSLPFTSVTVSADGQRVYVTSGDEVLQVNGIVNGATVGFSTPPNCPAQLQYTGVALSADNTVAYVCDETAILAIDLCTNEVTTLATASGIQYTGMYFVDIVLDTVLDVAYVTMAPVPGPSFTPSKPATSYLVTLDLTRVNHATNSFEIGPYYSKGLTLSLDRTIVYVAITNGFLLGTEGTLLQFDVSTGDNQQSDYSAGEGYYTEGNGAALSPDGKTVYFTLDSNYGLAAGPESGGFAYDIASASTTLVVSSNNPSIGFNGIAVSPDGNTLYIVTDDGTDAQGYQTGYDGTGFVYSVDLTQTTRSLTQIAQSSIPLIDVAVSADGYRLYVTGGSEVQTIYLSTTLGHNAPGCVSHSSFPAQFVLSASLPFSSLLDGVSLSADNTFAYVNTNTSILRFDLCNGGSVSTVATVDGLKLSGYFFNDIAVDTLTNEAFVTYNSVAAADYVPYTDTDGGFVARISLGHTNDLVQTYSFGSNYLRGVAYNSSLNSIYLGATIDATIIYAGGNIYHISSDALISMDVDATTYTNDGKQDYQAEAFDFTVASGIAFSPDGVTVYFSFFQASDSFNGDEIESRLFSYNTQTHAISDVIDTANSYYTTYSTVFNGLAVSPDGKTLYVAAANSTEVNGELTGFDGTGVLYAIDLTAFSIHLTEVATSASPFIDVMASADGTKLYATSGEDVLVYVLVDGASTTPPTCTGMSSAAPPIPPLFSSSSSSAAPLPPMDSSSSSGPAVLPPSTSTDSYYFSGVALNADNTVAYVCAESAILALNLCTDQVTTLATAQGLGLGDMFFNDITLDTVRGVAYVTYEPMDGADFDPANAYPGYLATVGLHAKNDLVGNQTVGFGGFNGLYLKGVALSLDRSTAYLGVTAPALFVDLTGAGLVEVNVSSANNDNFDYGNYVSHLTEANGMAVSPDGQAVYITVDSFSAEPYPGYAEGVIFSYNLTEYSGFTQVLNTSLVPNGIALSPDGSTLYVATSDGADSAGYHTGYDGSGVVYAVDLSAATPELTVVVATSSLPFIGVAVSADGKRLLCHHRRRAEGVPAERRQADQAGQVQVSLGWRRPAVHGLARRQVPGGRSAWPRVQRAVAARTFSQHSLHSAQQQPGHVRQAAVRRETAAGEADSGADAESGGRSSSQYE